MGSMELEQVTIDNYRVNCHTIVITLLYTPTCAPLIINIIIIIVVVIDT